MIRKLTFILLTQFIFLTAHSAEKESEKLLCSVDVVILEGSSIDFCQGEFVTINASSGFVSYAWTGPQTGSSPSLAPSSSGEYVVTAVDGVGCISSDTIDVVIHSNPVGVIISTEGTQLCPGSSGTVLGLTQAFNAYLWGGGQTSATIQVYTGGTYVVQVTDGNGCQGNSSITISQPNFTLTASGNATVCNGSTVTLTATGGTSYAWSTGETSSSIIVSPPVTTNYSVEITNGSCVQTLYQIVSTITMVNSEIQDTFYMAEGETVLISGPDDYDYYSWTPMVDLSNYSGPSTYFSGAASTQYTVNSTSLNGCMRSDDIWIEVIRLTIPTGFSPNGDFVNDEFVIPELINYDAHVMIFNRWGDKVYESTNYYNDWDGTCQADLCLGEGLLPEGTYFYSIDIENVHFDGYTTIKR